MAAGKWSLPVVALSALTLSSCGEMGSIPNPLGMGSGNIHVEAHSKTGDSAILRAGQPVVLLLGDVADARPAAPSRKVGDIRSTVIDMADTSLTLDRDVATAVSAALRDQLAADGFSISSDRNAAHDFEVDAKVGDFRLDIVNQDKLNIAVNVTLRDAKSGDVLWAGTVAESGHRFAGVAGNSRASIVAYFDRGLSAWAAKASANVRSALLKSYPQTMVNGARRESAPAQVTGVTTLQAATPREAAAAAVPPSAPTLTLPTAPAPNASGTFSLVTVPAHAKVYIDDVYYGTSPIKLALPPGVVPFRFQLDGFKTIVQKVSIRPGETTELQVSFEK